MRRSLRDYQKKRGRPRWTASGTPNPPFPLNGLTAGQSFRRNAVDTRVPARFSLHCAVTATVLRQAAWTRDGAPFSITEAFGHSHANTGWTLGYGTEGTLLIPGWTWKIEGLWMDLGSLDATGITSGVSASGHLCPCDVKGG